MKHLSAFSAVLPAFNAEPYLRRSINSVLAQTFEPLEVVVIDDGSTDGTAEIARGYGGAVRYFRQENRGGSAARNAGIRASRGEWIAFLDADDAWRPNHLANAASTLQGCPELRWYGAPVDLYIHETGELVTEYRKKKSKLLIDNAYFEDYLIAVPPFAFFSTPTMVIHRSVFEAVGMFDETKRSGHDLDLWFRIGLRFPKVGYCHTVGANIYRRGTSISYTKNQNYLQSLSTYRDREKLAESFGPDARRRAEPWIMYWVTKLLKANLGHGDIEAVREIYAVYRQRLPARWRLLARLALAVPSLFRRASAVRNRISSTHRMLRDTRVRTG